MTARFKIDVLTTKPHIAISGTTRSGKSVLIDQITRELYNEHRSARFILIDSKGSNDFDELSDRGRLNLIKLECGNGEAVASAIDFIESIHQELSNRVFKRNKSDQKVFLIIDELALLTSYDASITSKLKDIIAAGGDHNINVIASSQNLRDLRVFGDGSISTFYSFLYSDGHKFLKEGTKGLKVGEYIEYSPTGSKETVKKVEFNAGVLKDKPHVIIVGSSLTGKSTLLYKVLRDIHEMDKDTSFTLVDCKGGKEMDKIGEELGSKVYKYKHNDVGASIITAVNTFYLEFLERKEKGIKNGNRMVLAIDELGIYHHFDPSIQFKLDDMTESGGDYNVHILVTCQQPEYTSSFPCETSNRYAFCSPWGHKYKGLSEAVKGLKMGEYIDILPDHLVKSSGLSLER